VVIIAGAGTYILKHPKTPSTFESAAVRHDVAPGRNGAVLTLAGGRQIVLDSSAIGDISHQGSTTITNTNGLLAYRSVHGRPEETLYNTLTTDRGNQYEVILPDGSKAWLDAASSIKYPTAFSGADRQVEISGEVYFEIAKDKSKPFRVKLQDMDVEVLGTHFNVMAYTEEGAVKTTLLEGSVRVSASGIQKTAILKEGQQAQFKGGQLVVFNGVNTDEVVAWKEGLFDFENADLQTILRQYARWYNVTVVYEGLVKERKFYGIVKRSNSLKKVLDMLQDNDIVYTIEGNKLTIKSE
jgi:transmembrane sensor